MSERTLDHLFLGFLITIVLLMFGLVAGMLYGMVKSEEAWGLFVFR